MSKIEDVKQILNNLCVPTPQQSDLCCYTILAMANIKEDDVWSDATNEWIRIHDIISYTKAMLMQGFSFCRSVGALTVFCRRGSICKKPRHPISFRAGLWYNLIDTGETRNATHACGFGKSDHNGIQSKTTRATKITGADAGGACRGALRLAHCHFKMGVR